VNNVGGSFGSPAKLSEAGVEYDVSLAVDSDGKAHIVYDRMESPEICYVTNKPGGFGSPDCFGPYGGTPNIAVDGEGYVHIAYLSGGVKYANNISGPFSPILLADFGSLTNTGEGSRWFTVSSDDILHVVFHAGLFEQLESYEIYYLGVPVSELIKAQIYLPVVLKSGITMGF
jgi:hypothetical protein